MALGFGSKKTTSSDDSGNEKDTTQQFGGNYDGFSPDPEAQGATRYRKGSRIDRPVISSIAGNIEGRKPSVDQPIDEGEISIGKQLEAEAGNAIQYRTCSWQKVSSVWDRKHRVRARKAHTPSRLLHCSSPNISVWPSCHSHTPTPYSASCPVLS